MRDPFNDSDEVAPARSALDPLRQVSAGVVRWSGGDSAAARDELAVEEPLELRLPGARVGEQGAPIAAIMRTPGHDEELAAGFLFSEGLIHSAGELAGFVAGTDEDGLPSDNVLVAWPAPGVDLARRVREGGYSRQFAVNASCGICGKNSVAAACAALPPLPDRGADDAFPVDPAVLYGLPDHLRAEQRVFASTGGLHAAGLFDMTGALLALREDVGRHNAVDKLVGRALLDGVLPLGGRMLLVSGRLSFEIVLKALAAGIPLIAAVSAPSNLAVDLARAGNITLAGFLRGPSVNVYTHPWRIGAHGAV